MSQFASLQDDYSLLLRWRLTTASHRTVDPYGKTTQKQLASELIAQGGDRDAMQRAYNLDPWNPLVHLALAQFEEDPRPPTGCAAIRSTGCPIIPSSNARRPKCFASSSSRRWHWSLSIARSNTLASMAPVYRR
jgi:hypothetical protein